MNTEGRALFGGRQIDMTDLIVTGAGRRAGKGGWEMEQMSGLQPGGTEYDYNLLMSAMHVSVSKHLLEESFTMVWSNDFYYELIRYPREEYEALFHNRPDLYYQYHHYEGELQRINEVVMKTMQEGRREYSIITRMPVKGGGHIWVRMSGTFTDENYQGVPVAYTVITDITDLVEIKQEQSITYDNIPGFVAKYLIKDHHNMMLLDANDRFKEFFGLAEEEYNALLQQNLKDNEEQFAAQLEKVRRGEHIRFTCQLHSRKKKIWIQINGDCVDWLDGDPVYLLLYIDVTEMREMQQKLEEQTRQLRDALAGAKQASDAKRSFLSRMSHEIRTPMNAIIGMTTIAASHIEDQSRVEDCLKKIGFSSKHLLSLINDVLDMSKIEEGKLTIAREPFYLQQVLESVTAIIFPQAVARGVDFHTSLQDVTEEELAGDAVRVSQILLNLMSNAVKFTPAGGRVRLMVKGLPCKNNRVRLRFTISDTGRGMSEEFLARLYEPFEQERVADSEKITGTGLGMPITKNLVELLGGTISVSSHLGEGTVFTVELPFQLANASGQAVKYPVMSALKVLVTDNDPDDCMYTSLLLERFGIMTRRVFSGEEAVEEIRTAHNAGEDYDVCLIDWQMPDMDGIETTRKIRAIVGPDTLIIIITAYDYSQIEAAAREAGANLFLAKPLFASSLYNSLLFAAGTEQLMPGQSPGEAPPKSLFGRKFLLAEDNDLNGEIAEELLRMAGAKVHWVKDGNEALEWFLSPEGRTCDAILMDIQMPEMDGYQATRAIRAASRDNAASIPIIAMTANAFREDVTAALEAGMNAHIAKPVDVIYLYRVLERCMEQHANAPIS